MKIWIGQDYILRLSHYTRNSNFKNIFSLSPTNISIFRDLNNDPSVHGIIVQMPLDSEQEVEILFEKDHLSKSDLKILFLCENEDS